MAAGCSTSIQLNSMDLALAFSTVEGEAGCHSKRSVANLQVCGRGGGILQQLDYALLREKYKVLCSRYFINLCKINTEKIVRDAQPNKSELVLWCCMLHLCGACTAPNFSTAINELCTPYYSHIHILDIISELI